MNQIQSSLKSKAKDEFRLSHGRIQSTHFEELKSIPVHLAKISNEHECVFNRFNQKKYSDSH